jgi:hypothetical protein
MYLGNEMPESKQVHEAMAALLKKFKEKVVVS